MQLTTRLSIPRNNRNTERRQAALRTKKAGYYAGFFVSGTKDSSEFTFDYPQSAGGAGYISLPLN